MMIKSFTGDSVANALKKVRVEMGGDAVVLKTRQVADQGDGNTIEITACLDRPSAAQASATLATKPKAVAAPAPRLGNRMVSAFTPERVSPLKAERSEQSESPSQTLTTIEKKLDDLIKLQSTAKPIPAQEIQPTPVVQVLRDADFSDAAIADLLSKNNSLSDKIEDWVAPLAAWISGISDLKTNFSAGDRIAFVGESGAGKTSALGKLTAYLLSRKQSVVLATADAGKVGAIDEMYSYADLLGATVAEAVPDGSFDAYSRKHVLIDASLGQVKDVDRLRASLEVWRPTHRLLVCSALTRRVDLTAFTTATVALAPTHVVMTMTDRTHRLGGVLSICLEKNLKLMFVTNGPSGVGFLTSPDAHAIATAILTGGMR